MGTSFCDSCKRYFQSPSPIHRCAACAIDLCGACAASEAGQIAAIDTSAAVADDVRCSPARGVRPSAERPPLLLFLPPTDPTGAVRLHHLLEPHFQVGCAGCGRVVLGAGWGGAVLGVQCAPGHSFLSTCHCLLPVPPRSCIVSTKLRMLLPRRCHRTRRSPAPC